MCEYEEFFGEAIDSIKMIEDLLTPKEHGRTCIDCAQICQMMGLNMPACSSYIAMDKE